MVTSVAQFRLAIGIPTSVWRIKAVKQKVVKRNFFQGNGTRLFSPSTVYTLKSEKDQVKTGCHAAPCFCMHCFEN